MRIVVSVFLFVLILSLIALPSVTATPQLQAPEVYAEALGTANLRSGASTEYDIVGEIAAGTPYRVVQQHALVPWILLEVPELASGGGWVFNDLVQITSGDLATIPVTEAFEELSLTGGSLPVPAPAGEAEDAQASAAPAANPDAVGADTTGNSENPANAANPIPTAAAPAEGQAVTSDAAPQDASSDGVIQPAVPVGNLVTATLTGRSNIRYAPGVDYPTIATMDAGTVLTMIARHSGLPWYQVVVEGSPTGTGWISESVIDITGDPFTLDVVTELTFDFPTPSPTPNTVTVAQSPVGLGNEGAALANSLGLTIDSYLLNQGLAPRTDREASVFVLDLLSGEHFTLNGGVAYSGMSINKIPVLVSYFLERDRALETRDAELVATTMICSENTATNQMMTEVGDGDILEGGQRVTNYMQQLGLGNSFVVAPFYTGNPDATPAPVSSIQTNVDQDRTQPDLFNQLTVEETGWLLGSMYQCAADGTGPLVDAFGDQITQVECQQMFRVMSGNKIGRLIEAGIGDNATLAHKHGWINNTHGDAGIVIGPEGAYVLSMIYHQRSEWLEYDQSFPVLEEISRQTWNYFNPSNQISTLNQPDISETCDIYGETVIPDMLSGNIAVPTLSAPVTTPVEAVPTLTPTPQTAQ